MAAVRIAARSFTSQLSGSETIHIRQGEIIDGEHEAVCRYADRFMSEQEHRRQVAKRAARNPANLEAGAEFPTRGGPAPARGNPTRSAALRTVERYSNSGHLIPEAADRLDAHLRSDPTDLDSEYLVATADEHYHRAFGRILCDPGSAHLRMSREEHAALERVNRIQYTRALSVFGGSGNQGGFAIPAALDPSVMLSSDGTLNPLRRAARLVTMVGNEWKGVTSSGVSASYDGEAAEVCDDTPTLVQPTLYAEKAQAFVPPSIEVSQDWSTLATEMALMLQDAKDRLESSMFLTGRGHASAEPEGVLVGLGNGQKVLSAGTAAYGVADCYSLMSDIPPRFQANSAVMISPAVADASYRMLGPGSAEPPVISADRQTYVGRPLALWSEMDDVLTSGKKVAIAGDFRQSVVIGDRIGATLEVIAHLFGASGRPTGQRGFYMYWRSGCSVVNPAGLRYLEVK
ncbi:phage major capsid protein [Capillimicrobium parvum]|uniref:Phage capsid-like C-terminal domain-containing protein n=1 Tax=Capillimicrobium parvum TaxID=2884022 RepID=A0A9E6XUA6_9ACTN|nr:phage major capsid protein [Capillimicrobium parvum]UGS34253.1 hypothetical protein DSM104329_00629 [Capillimicrobium parvum]